jgi:hypothetical protein
MINSSQSAQHGVPRRCAVCDGPFGLIRYYSWRTPLCSKKCVEHLKGPPRGGPQLVGAISDRLRMKESLSWALARCRLQLMTVR